MSYTYRVKRVSYSGLSCELAEGLTAEEAKAYAYRAAERASKKLGSSFEALANGTGYEVLEPEDSATVSDLCGYYVAKIYPPLQDCHNCGGAYQVSTYQYQRNGSNRYGVCEDCANEGADL